MTQWQTIDALKDIAEDLPRFTQALIQFSARLGLDITSLEADHISLRCHQNTTAERWRRGFEQCGELLSENIISGRPICLFKLAQPLNVAHWRFTVVELPWPGEKRYPHEGWEHIEIVLPGAVETLNARALALMSDEGLSQSGIAVKTSSPKGEHERLPNPTLAVTDGKTTIKFHPWSIEAIVASEARAGNENFSCRIDS
ncbi:metalloprotein [Superficieibacter electus]|uniref:Metalloprotein n=1 Tax=Superficieibacter electus TaxID=2022662 RepID=A0A2P5GP53_9ENTR|nr:VOC family protein [Superficieibacter electus]POP44966.1 metalloprotein [Superficieibacter electus]POP48353.1 metalloprotein [Superficieibacter electus]